MVLAQILEKYMPDDSTVKEIVDFFSIFSHETRIKILNLLSISEFCVNDIVYALGINQTTVSHQLKSLKDAGIINCYRNGKRIVYFLSNDNINDFMSSALKTTESLNINQEVS